MPMERAPLPGCFLLCSEAQMVTPGALCKKRECINFDTPSIRIPNFENQQKLIRLYASREKCRSVLINSSHKFIFLCFGLQIQQRQRFLSLPLYLIIQNQIDYRVVILTTPNLEHYWVIILGSLFPTHLQSFQLLASEYYYYLQYFAIFAQHCVQKQAKDMLQPTCEHQQIRYIEVQTIALGYLSLLNNEHFQLLPDSFCLLVRNYLFLLLQHALSQLLQTSYKPFLFFLRISSRFL